MSGTRLTRTYLLISLISVFFIASIIFLSIPGQALPKYFAQSQESQNSPRGARPELVVQNGHTADVSCVAFSPNGKLLATGSKDETTKIWDVKTGRVIATLSGHRYEEDGIVYSTPIKAIAFSPDGNLLATGSNDRKLLVWDLSTAKTRVALPGHEGEITAIAFTRDGKTLISACEDNNIRFFNVATWKCDHTIKADKYVKKLAINPQGTVLAVTADNLIKLYDLPSGKPLSTIKQEYVSDGIAFSPDGTLIASIMWSKRIVIWNTKTGAETATFRIEELISGADLSAFVGLSFTPKGTLAFATFDHIGILDLASKKVISSAKDREPISSFSLNREGTAIAVGEANGAARVYDVASMKETACLEGRSSKVCDFAFSGDGAILVTGSLEGTVTVWNLASGKIDSVYPGEASVFAVTLSRSGKEMAAGYRDGMVRLWDLASRTLKFERKAHEGAVLALAFTPDDLSLVSAGEDKEAKIWDLKSQKMKARFEHPAGISSVAVSPDGEMLATASFDGKIRQWSMKERSVVIERTPPVDATYRRAWSVAISPNGRYVAAGLQDGTVKIWEAGLEELDKDLNAQCRRPAYSISFSSDGQMLAMGMDLKTIIWDVTSGREIARFEGDGNIAISPNGKIIATGSPDSTMRFWKIADGKLIATAIVLDEGKNWAVTTPQGLFDGSADGMKIIEWRLNNKLYTLEQFFNDYYTPGLLSKALSSENLSSATQDTPRDISHLPAPPKVSIVSPKNNERLSKSKILVRIRVKEELGGGISNLRLYLNGHRLSSNTMKSKGKDMVEFTVELVRGLNRIRATAFNKDGSVESRSDEIGVICNTSSPGKPTLFVLSVGIDKYKSGLRLNYAIKDANSIASYFKPGLFVNVKSLSLIDEEAGKDGILEALKKISQDATPQDSVLVYLAGHGLSLGNSFYFLPHDAKLDTKTQVQSTSLSSLELGQALSNIVATKQILILDACHSGGTSETLGRLLSKTDAADLIRAQQSMARSSGTFLIAASTEEQYAAEIPELGHGVLTYAILSGLGDNKKPAAPVNKEGMVTVNALLQYVSGEVPKLTQQFQGFRQEVVQFSTGQDFPLAKKQK